jgi:hypothetical protein
MHSGLINLKAKELHRTLQPNVGLAAVDRKSHDASSEKVYPPDSRISPDIMPMSRLSLLTDPKGIFTIREVYGYAVFHRPDSAMRAGSHRRRSQKVGV